MDLSQRGETSHFSDPKSIATCKDPVTILLLGTADSGKSTVVKQMKVIFNQKMSIIKVVLSYCKILKFDCKIIFSLAKVRHILYQLSLKKRRLFICKSN